VLIGPAGVGKTTLARAAASRLSPRFGRVDWVTATAPTAAVPFAAFGHLIDVGDTGKTAEVLRVARESLGDGRLLVVDDAHLLDRLSAALVYQLAVSGVVTLVVTRTRRPGAPWARRQPAGQPGRGVRRVAARGRASGAGVFGRRRSAAPVRGH
jgi:replication-associated recombination protein RarA